MSAGTRHVVVVGAGFSGLSAACRLRAQGHEVTVVEANEAPGGWAGAVHHSGYRFDAGPTVVTMVDLLADTFASVGATIDEHCSMTRLDPFYTANYADGSQVRVRGSLDATRAELSEVIGPDAGAELDRFVHWLERLHELEFDTFIDRDITSVWSMLGDWRRLAGLVTAGGFRSWHATAASHFTDDRLRRLFSFQAMYAGLSPLDALALFAIIAHMDSVQGVYAPVGGVHALAAGLADAAGAAGVELRYGRRVERIVPDGSRPQVRFTDGEQLVADVVVVTADLPVAKRELFGLAPSWGLRRATPSPSCLVWHLAAEGELPEHTSHHNIHFGHAWATAFDDLFEAGRPMTDPSRFVTVGSLSDPTAAPAGGHALFVLEPVPNLTADLDWATLTPRLTDRMLTWADAAGYPTSGAEVVTVVDPPTWRHRGGTAGTPFSLAHRFLQSGPFRPAPEDPGLPGIVFAGAGTRPGVGIPMVLISGRIAAERAHALLGAHR